MTARRGAGEGGALRRFAVGRRRWWAVLAFALSLCAAVRLSPAPPNPSRMEYRVKAAILYNLLKFVEWPPKVNAATLCVLGEDPFGAALDEIVRGKRVDGRPVTVRRHRDPVDIAGCGTLFIAASESRRVQEIVRAAHEDGMLTVSDIQDFASRGGAIGLNVLDGKVRFDINLKAAQRACVRISSQLLELAGVVKPGEGQAR